MSAPQPLRFAYPRVHWALLDKLLAAGVQPREVVASALETKDGWVTIRVSAVATGKAHTLERAFAVADVTPDDQAVSKFLDEIAGEMRGEAQKSHHDFMTRGLESVVARRR